MDDLWFYTFLSIFKSYKDDGRVIMKGSMQWNPIYIWKDIPIKQESNSVPLGQQASA